MIKDKSIPVETLKSTIAYYYALSYCSPEKIADFKRISAPMRKKLAKEAGMKEDDYFALAIPDVCRRIAAFHQGLKEPDEKIVEALVEAARKADESPAAVIAFQTQMTRLAELPARSKTENRLHRNKGCRFCLAACRYGYFTLISDPQFYLLQEMLEKETEKPQAEQNPSTPVRNFTLSHLTNTLGAGEGLISAEHLVNLSYCLLVLSMAKSRLALPEEQLKIFQSFNQAFLKSELARKKA